MAADGVQRHVPPVVQLPVGQVPPHEAPHERLTHGRAAPLARFLHHPPRAALAIQAAIAQLEVFHLK